MTELERLDMCIAEVNGVRDVAEGYHRDWRALMAAVEKLELTGYCFHRSLDVERPHLSFWMVSRDGETVHEERWTLGDDKETEALAKCIAAAVEHKERLGRAEEGGERE